MPFRASLHKGYNLAGPSVAMGPAHNRPAMLRDVLHLYFARKGEPFQAIGSFEVTSYKEHKQPIQFQDKWSGIPIVEVVDPKLCKLLTPSGHKRDPHLRAFAG
jgi:hypothetical protein